MVFVFSILIITATSLYFTEATMREWISRPRSRLYVNAGETARIEWKFPAGAKAVTYEKRKLVLEKGIRIAYKFDAAEPAIVDGYKSHIRIENSGALSILKAGLKDEGYYSINIVYKSNTLVDDVQIILQEIPVITTFPTHAKSEVFYMGMTINLLCMAKGRPVPEVQWFKDGEDKPLQESKGSILHQIKSASKDDSGRYSCIATNNAGKASRSIDYVILRRPYNIEFFHNTALDGTIYEGQSVVFTCSAKGNPSITYYKFLHNGKELHKSSSGVYKINEVRHEDNGTYCCIPINKAGLGENGILVLRVQARPSYWQEKLKRTTIQTTTEKVFARTTENMKISETQSTESLLTDPTEGHLGRAAGDIVRENTILLSLLVILSLTLRQFA